MIATWASSPSTRGDDLINAWLAVEAFNPQTCLRQEKLLGNDLPRADRRSARPPSPYLHLWDLKETDVMPWDTPQGLRQNLGLKDNELIRWFIPLGFIKMEPAIEQLAARFENDGPERERGQGLAVAVLAAFDGRGYPDRDGFIISSFAWACGKALRGEIEDLHRFTDLEDDLCEELHRALIKDNKDEQGHQQPTTRSSFLSAMSCMADLLGLPKDLLERPRVAIRILGDQTHDALTIVNSFFLKDLYHVRETIKREPPGPGLSAYLFDRQSDERPIDVLADKSSLEALVAPAITPKARWPSPKPVSLVTLQQAAVNHVTSGLRAGGIQGINGPPGTGKTTLLRDVVASVLLERAKALSAFDDPETAFTEKETVVLGSRPFKLYALDAALRGFGIVAASANNAAVENISRELPGAQTVDQGLNLRYFRSIAKTLAGKDEAVWGLAAAVLGRAKNRRDFADNFWWHETHSFKGYLAGPTGRYGARDDEPDVITAEDPPRSRRQALAAWKRARAAFQEALSKAERALQLQENVRTAIKNSAAFQQAKEDAETVADKADEAAGEAVRTVQALEKNLRSIEQDVADDRLNCDMLLNSRPTGLRAIVGTLTSPSQDALDEARQALARSRERKRQIEDDLAKAKTMAAHARRLAKAKRQERDKAEARLREIERVLKMADFMPPECMAGPGFWEQHHDDLHKASPWGDAETQRVRDALFKAVMNLHRAFIDAAAYRLRSNLAIFMNHLKGRRVPSGPDAYLADLWDTFFLVIPLVSTTFASFARLFDGLSSESLGWLLIDEAGQASPQMALGAIWRSRRSIVIGDPLQIEPVVAIPKGLRRAIFSGRGLEPDHWSAPETSVQGLADRVSDYQTVIESSDGDRSVGLPLLVHRRCADPMFTISNEIAYGGKMVHAASNEPSRLFEALQPVVPRSCWLHVDSKSQKWSVDEGKAVLHLLDRLMIFGADDPDLYFISPFKDVAKRLRDLLGSSNAVRHFSRQNAGKWVNRRVGTVHTFQGKEAELVFLVLGASADERSGSRSWASEAPNILNVASTRAKRGLIVVGNYEAWRTSGHFRTAADVLPVIDWRQPTAQDRRLSRAEIT